MMKQRRILLVSLCTLAAVALAGGQGGRQDNLEMQVRAKLPTLGHRNWIVVADSAYPMQVSPGIETITVNESQIDAVRQVLRALSKTRHVRPAILIDRELAFVPEKHAPGITAFRKALDGALQGRSVQRMLHGDIIAKLDEAGKTFKVLLIKTPHTQPYTSVFFQLECGYWSDAAEKELRRAMEAKGAGR